MRRFIRRGLKLKVNKAKHGKPLSFIDWINQEGVTKVAGLLDVDTSTVRHWRRGHSFPRIEVMQAIKKITKGRITYEHIIEGKRGGTK